MMIKSGQQFFNSSNHSRIVFFVSIFASTLSLTYYAYKKLRSKTRNKIQSVKIIEDISTASIDDKQNYSVSKSWNSLGLEQPLVIAMVGLPARGKSYIVKMIIRYLMWTGFETEVFNVGSYRRKLGLAGADSTFFSSGNTEGQKIREEMAMAVQDIMYEWLHGCEGKRRVAIFDATNTTRERRQALAIKAKHENCFLLFVESICNDKDVLLRNYELKLQNDDYKSMDPITARADFMDRVSAYEKVYETIEDDEDSNQISYIKLIDVCQKVISRNCTGYLPSQVGFYLQNVHIQQRKIYLSLNAETFGTLENKYKSQSEDDDGKLTDSGRMYSLNMAKYIDMDRDSIKDAIGRELMVLAGTALVHAETILHLRMIHPCYTTPLLNELRGGDLHGKSPTEIELRYPDEYKKRKEDKLRYRYPGVGGESYLDVIERLRPVVIELERQRRSVLVVCNVAVLRCIYAYFTGINVDEIPKIPVHKHRLLELTPGPFGCQSKIVDPFSELSHM